ncbi:hypothetical protein Ahy_A02g009526 isoform A [Arachis hypogaea]|uniref:Uncharacterized protein n=1 Tax=Arachis hypogaea TaxID=3818 RepID=A0A445EHD0_ARAHY|nr:hypothetical protein Ahy_A02g009526 isoform A [Arachis hypogaea]
MAMQSWEHHGQCSQALSSNHNDSRTHRWIHDQGSQLVGPTMEPLGLVLWFYPQNLMVNSVKDPPFVD